MLVTNVVKGTGALLNVYKEKVGGMPRSVKLFNVTRNTQGYWNDTMADDSAQITVDSGAGTTDISLITSGGIIPLASGFSIGTNASLNTSGDTIHYEADIA